jgi:hypothetical protein
MKVRQNLLGLTIADDMAWACVMWHFGGNWIMQLSVDADRRDAGIMLEAQAFPLITATDTKGTIVRDLLVSLRRVGYVP